MKSEIGQEMIEQKRKREQYSNICQSLVSVSAPMYFKVITRTCQSVSKYLNNHQDNALIHFLTSPQKNNIHYFAYY